jgi:hypothetical protein
VMVSRRELTLDRPNAEYRTSHLAPCNANHLALAVRFSVGRRTLDSGAFVPPVVILRGCSSPTLSQVVVGRWRGIKTVGCGRYENSRAEKLTRFRAEGGYFPHLLRDGEVVRSRVKRCGWWLS